MVPERGRSPFHRKRDTIQNYKQITRRKSTRREKWGAREIGNEDMEGGGEG